MNASNPRSQPLTANLIFFSFGLAFWIVTGLTLCYSTFKWGNVANQQVMMTKMLDEANIKWQRERDFSLRLFDQRDELRKEVEKLKSELEDEKQKRKRP